jgi:hypothetical protein
MDQDIRERFDIFMERLEGHKSRARGFSTSKRIQKKVEERLQEKVITPPQIKTLLYLLGFEDNNYSPLQDGPFGLSSSTYNRKVKPLIKEDSEIDLRFFGFKSLNYGMKAYKLTGLNDILTKLSEEGRISYSDDRLKEAHSLV